MRTINIGRLLLIITIYCMLPLQGLHAEKTVGKLTGNTMGYMHQYYIANREVSDFKICVNPQVDHVVHAVSDGWHIEQNIHLANIQEPSSTYRPKKTVRYFINKYLLTY